MRPWSHEVTKPRTSGKDLIRREGRERERERGPDWRLEMQAKLEERRYRTIMTKPERVLGRSQSGN